MDVYLNRYHQQVRKLCAVALARLPRMIDPATGLCVFRVDGPQLIPSGTSVRYTAVVALGLERAEQHGLRSSLDRGRLYEALSATCAGVDNVGDLGLVLWAAARSDRPLAERALRDLLEFDDAVTRRRSSEVRSTELAWVVSGLAEALAADVGIEHKVRSRLDRAFRRLLEQRGPSGLVCFSRPAGKDRHRLDPRVGLHESLGFFDAQVYTIVAALRRDAVVCDPEARDAARTIGQRMLRHQRALGQWGWHYDVRTGGMVDLYPVYSVHQDGMAPMALLSLERALGTPTTAAVARGVDWLFGRNELDEPLVNEVDTRIWRSVRRRSGLRSVVYPLKALSLVGIGGSLDLASRLAAPTALEVDREFRPYHMGWCLYAFAPVAAAAMEDDSDARPTLKTGHAPEPTGRTETSNVA